MWSAKTAEVPVAATEAAAREAARVGEAMQVAARAAGSVGAAREVAARAAGSVWAAKEAAAGEVETAEEARVTQRCER